MAQYNRQHICMTVHTELGVGKGLRSCTFLTGARPPLALLLTRDLMRSSSMLDTPPSVQKMISRWQPAHMLKFRELTHNQSGGRTLSAPANCFARCNSICSGKYYVAPCNAY